MSSVFASYILCGTPRSGSTLLCEMLAATGLAGRPNSYFRQEDIRDWAQAWNIPLNEGTDTPAFDRAYLEAMRRAGSAGTGVFGLRLMWNSTVEATKRLNRASGADRDLAQALEAVFGPMLHVHVSRRDKIAQAVSLVRAEQSGLWHLAADGTVLEGGKTLQPMFYDGKRIAEIVDGLERDDQSWNAFFDAQSIAPLRLVYETVAADPIAALQMILTALGQNPDVTRRIEIPTAKMADSESVGWMERFRREADLPDTRKLLVRTAPQCA